MRKIIKTAAALTAGITALAALAGCHGSRETDSFVMPGSFDESVKHEITFWAKNDTNKAQTNIYEKAIADFEALYPSITVNMRLYTDYGKIYNDVITNIPTRTTPNVCITYPDHIATYMTGENTVVELDGLMNDPKYGLGGSMVRFGSPSYGEMIPKFLNECRLAGHYYAVPYMRSSEACYINKDFVEKLGYTLPDTLTWDFVWEVSEAATEKNSDGTYKVNGQKVMIPFIYKSTDNMMITMLKQLGAGYSDSSGNIGLFSEETKNILYQVSEHVKSGAFSTFKISSYPGNFLNAGQCIFAVDSTAGATWMGTKATHHDISKDTIVDFETVVMTIPQYDPAHPQMISQGPSMCLFNKDDPQEVLASWLFMQFLLTNDVQTAYAETEGYVPVTSKAQTSPEYTEYLSLGGTDDDVHYSVKIDATKMVLNNIDNTFTTPVFNGSASLRDAASQLVESTAKSTRRKETIDEAYFEKLYADTSSLYRLDSISVEGKAELGELPAEAVALIVTLISVWCLILLYLGISALSKRKKRKKAQN
ncbi:MAG: ABC transporter substrate-binding protein [Ruminiclostridium sp.]|nr:ABC transporter substrate-binding protein [Ruminiclostridium sp.]